MRFAVASTALLIASAAASYAPEPKPSEDCTTESSAAAVTPTYPAETPAYPIETPSSAEPVQPSSTPCDESTAVPVYPSETPSSAEPVYPSSTPCDESSAVPVYPTETPSSAEPVYPSETPSGGYPATTQVVTSYTTFCPSATTISHGSETYVVTTPTTVTFGGPVTVVKPIYSSTVTICNDCPAPTGYLPSSPIYPTASSPVYPTGSTPGPAIPTFTGGAPRTVVGAGAALTGLLGLAAYLL
ncbi:hypothetical protein FQN50_005605 [Emmonsiellopsis sp. PD_5]|nr:hypothetical protein FQN50_005605 [Emmonsiellopsis sp. PD_5]